MCPVVAGMLPPPRPNLIDVTSGMPNLVCAKCVSLGNHLSAPWCVCCCSATSSMCVSSQHVHLSLAPVIRSRFATRSILNLLKFVWCPQRLQVRQVPKMMANILQTTSNGKIACYNKM